MQEAADMEEMCQDFDTYDEASLIEEPELVDIDVEKYNRANKEDYKKHYGKTKKAINAENMKILSTQAKCMAFVKKHRGHEKVCNWCRARKAPAVQWKWNAADNVWYRYYDGKWHYWGPSKSGFTEGGWTWYKGYWHHNGYVFKYVNGTWYRFQGKVWTKYGDRVPVRPGIPRGKRICRPFYLLKKFGYPTSLSAKRLPRCVVGSGKKAQYYMWKNTGACKFLGGRLTYQTQKICKAGKPHSWARVTRCVRGPVLTNKGFSYKHGKAAPKKDIKKTTTRRSAVPKCPAKPVGNALRSIHGRTRVHVTFVNTAKQTVKLMWHDYKGKMRSYGNIPAGGKKGMTTYATHPWSITSLVRGKKYMINRKVVWSAVSADKGKKIVIAQCS
jgi:hypothetical protein